MLANALVHLSCKPGERWVLSCLIASTRIIAYLELVHPGWEGSKATSYQKDRSQFMSSLQYTQQVFAPCTAIAITAWLPKRAGWKKRQFRNPTSIVAVWEVCTTTAQKGERQQQENVDSKARTAQQPHTLARVTVSLPISTYPSPKQSRCTAAAVAAATHMPTHIAGNIF